LVSNKIDQQPLDLDKRGLMLKYPQIRAIVETSCLDGRGLAELRAAIEQEIAGLPHVRDELLQSWFNVKTKAHVKNKCNPIQPSPGNEFPGYQTTPGKPG
jgi:hypothetical protein